MNLPPFQRASNLSGLDGGTDVSDNSSLVDGIDNLMNIFHQLAVFLLTGPQSVFSDLPVMNIDRHLVTDHSFIDAT